VLVVADNLIPIAAILGTAQSNEKINTQANDPFKDI
jgi:hypothetical protein